MVMLVTDGGKKGQGERDSSISDGRTPSWWAIAVVLQDQTEACLKLACASKPSYSYTHRALQFLPPASRCQPTVPAQLHQLPQGTSWAPLYKDSYLVSLRTAQESAVSKFLQGIQRYVCTFSIFSTKSCLERWS